MKRLISMVLCLLICVCSAGMAEEYLVSEDNGAAAAAQGTQATGGGALQTALNALNSGSLLDALNAFAKLGSVDDANRYAVYAQALLSLQREDLDAAVTLFSTINGFLDSDYQLAFAQTLRLHRYAENGKFGYVDASGAWKIAPQFDWAERVFRRESASAHSRDQSAYQAEDLYMVAKVFTGTTEAGEADTQPLEGKYGLMRNDGVLIVPAQYAEILWTVNGIAAVSDGTKAYLFSIASGDAIGSPYEAVGEYAGGYIAVQQRGLWGYLDPKTGALIGAGCVWESALPFSEGKAGVSLEDKAGFINASGTAVINLQFDKVASFSEGLAAVRIKKRWGFINAKGVVTIPASYAAAQTFQNGLCAVQKGSAWGLINAKNEVVLRIKYSEIGSFDPIYHRAWIRQNKLWGLVSSAGTIVLKPAWATHDEFSANTLCRVSYKKRYGFIDASGKTRIANLYLAASPFRADYAAVQEESGSIRYLSKTQRGFIIKTDVPVECLCGFIEGRQITETSRQVMDATGWSYAVVDRSISYALFDSEGNAIMVPAYQAGQSAS